MTEQLKRFYVGVDEEDFPDIAERYKAKLPGPEASELEKPAKYPQQFWDNASPEKKSEIIADVMAEAALLQGARNLVALYKHQGAEVLEDVRNGAKLPGTAGLLVAVSRDAENELRGLPGLRVSEALNFG